MTATLVARLVESGAIKWGDTVGAMLEAKLDKRAVRAVA
jgi:CubicO group peptidase (beta-lactamase class C family)